MRLNKKMREVLGTKSPDEWGSGVKLEERLSAILDKGIIELRDAIVLGIAKKNARNTPLESFTDITGYECYLNHIHIEDDISETDSIGEEQLRQGIAFAIKTKEILYRQFPGKHFSFIIVLSKDGCTVRFHVIRGQESWLPDNIDSFTEEAILVFSS